jgi:DsbC/DsbD-like thiol-disulfide interchange protein
MSPFLGFVNLGICEDICIIIKSYKIRLVLQRGITSKTHGEKPWATITHTTHTHLYTHTLGRPILVE